MFKPPFGLYCPLFRSSSYPAPMAPESRTDFSSNQSKNPFFWPGCVACVARSRHPSVARSRSPSSPPRSLPSPQSRDRPFATQHRPPPEVARSIGERTPRRRPFTDRRVARASSRPIDRARAPIARVARARRSRVARAAPRPSRPRSRSRSRRLQDKTKRRPAHLARGGLLPRDALRPGRVRGVHDDARGANGKHVSRWRRRACLTPRGARAIAARAVGRKGP